MKKHISDKRQKSFIITIAAALSVIILRSTGILILGGTAVYGTVWYTALLSVISLLPPMLFSFTYEKPEKRKKAGLVPSAAMTAAAVLLCMGINIIISLLSGTGADVPQYSDPWSFAAAVLCLCLLPALLEELLFRGIITDALCPCGEKLTVVLSAAAFAIVHSGVYAGIYAFCAGIILGILRLRSGRLTASAAAHFLTNLISLII